MTTRDPKTEPIRSLSDWKSVLFPNVNIDVPDDSTSPTDIAVKLATKAINSLPNRVRPGV